MKAIVFVFDSLRADHVSTYGHSRKTTPNMDAIASDGVVFEQAFSQAIWTTPSSGSILTGRYPLSHGRLAWEDRIAESAETIATPFQEDDVHTCAISTMATVSEQGGYDEGFDEFIDLFDEISPTDPRVPEVVSERVVEWLDENADRDFLLFVWSSGTHTPYQTPTHDEFAPGDEQELGSIPSLKRARPEQADEVRDLYDNTIHYNDEQFGRVVDKLESLDIYDETLLALLSDHGEIFDEHARLEHAERTAGPLLETLVPSGIRERNRLFTPQGWLGHQAVLPYDELLHVPMILKFPGNEHAGTRVTSLVQNVDVGATIVDALLDENWDSAQGQSLLPTLAGEDVNDYVYSTSSVIGGDVLYHSVRDEEFKYVRLTSETPSWKNIRRLPKRALGSQLLWLINGSEKLFYTDRGEQRADIEEERESVATLEDRYEAWIRDDTTTDRTTGGDVSGETEDRLRELGYLE